MPSRGFFRISDDEADDDEADAGEADDDDADGAAVAIRACGHGVAMAVALGPGSEGWSLEGWGLEGWSLEGWNRVLLGWQAEDGALGLLAAGVI
jgi:hypothetical protein